MSDDNPAPPTSNTNSLLEDLRADDRVSMQHTAWLEERAATEIERLTRELAEEKKLSAAISRDCNAVALERNAHWSEIGRLRTALERLANGYKYPAEVCQIAREALKGEPDSAPERQLSASEAASISEAFARSPRRVSDETSADCSTGVGGVTLQQMAENIKLGLDPYAGAETSERRSLAAGSARIAAQIAHATYHIIDDYGAEHAQTGVCSVEIPKDDWDEWNRIVNLLGDDPHEALHDLIGVNDPEPSEKARGEPTSGSGCPACGVMYVAGARHFSGCPLHPGEAV